MFTLSCYNRAVNISGDAGAVCVRNVSVLINNSTFVAHIASGDAGTLQAEQSNMTISNSIFSNSAVKCDGGALFTSAHLSNYTITSSTFTITRLMIMGYCVHREKGQPLDG